MANFKKHGYRHADKDRLRNVPYRTDNHVTSQERSELRVARYSKAADFVSEHKLRHNSLRVRFVMPKKTSARWSSK